ncbi:MAG: hypothetical protein ACRBFS_16555 [Aureispira sp.]
MRWMFYPIFLLFPLYANAQVGIETSVYDALAFDILSKDVLKNNTLAGDCQCSDHLHANYALVLKDTIYQQTLEESFVLFFMNLEHNPFPQEVLWDVLIQFYTEKIKITTIGNRAVLIPSSKKINPPQKNKAYYLVTRINPLQVEETIFACFLLEEIRKDQPCTPIFVTLVLDKQAHLLEAKTATLCD